MRHPPSQVINSAVGETTSVYAAQCMHDLVANDTDLVLLEPSIADWEALDRPSDKGLRASLNNSVR